ncbi:diaminobutyrate acetyltransferase (plasmid) [Aminobacter sp. BA135]|uniref:diaminobutyrate acetyltransferase n=1 Tax=Aminobacter sp. BA135 TaxID=537596 RepID=UPI003D7A34AD
MNEIAASKAGGAPLPIKVTRGRTAIRTPRSDDGPRVWQLIRQTPGLDDNSLYCNLLQCSHFASTCAIAESDNEIVGWMSGYIPPQQQSTLFVWQICVSPAGQRQGLAKKLVADVLARQASSEVDHIECTITECNAASWALFRSIASKLDAPMARRSHFSREVHFNHLHDSEFAVTIGPFHRDGTARIAV